ncbi:helix-turn-helix domain-containing protein [Romboutsia timonensis]|uniref:helix-turn-helix domain-containing protein n=1 Tax=Romboutsia timonensis TaxID=1776391 RepID=UPI003FA79B2E
MLGERLRKSRLELGLSIPEVAELCNVTKSVISGYECNRINPTKDVLDLLCSKFDIYYLLYGRIYKISI